MSDILLCHNHGWNHCVGVNCYIMKVNWRDFAKFLSAAIAAIGVIAGLYAQFSAQPASIGAQLTYSYQNYPRQFIQNISQANEKFRYKDFYEKVKSISNENLSHDEVNSIVEYARESHFSMFDAPFENGIEQYQVKIFLYIYNDSKKVAKDIIITLPEPAVVLIKNEAAIYSAPK